MTDQILVMGTPSLYEPSQEITDFSDPDLQNDIEKMLYWQKKSEGVGIAAPQIGINKRIVIVGYEDSSRYPHIEAIPVTPIINPEYEPLSDEQEDGWEGCLSVPGMRGLVPRYVHITCRGFNPDGTSLEFTASGFHARIVQHEVDHVNGILFPMRVDNMADFGFESAMLERMGQN